MIGQVELTFNLKIIMDLMKTIADAASGDIEAQYALGLAYDQGLVVQRNLSEAISWYQKAADQGHALARGVLGLDVAMPIDEVRSRKSHRVTKIFGPPGTGKTTELIKQIQEAIANGVDPDKIGFFSFTNKSTEEAKNRMVEIFPQFNIETDFPYFQTIHSLANNALQTKVNVISDRQAKDFDATILIERPFMKEGDENSQVVRIKHPILDSATTARAKKIPFEQYLRELPSSQRWPINKWLNLPFSLSSNPISNDGILKCLAYNEKYELYKNNLDVIDFADMLDKAIINKMSLPSLKLLLIDEAQDLSPVQWDIANILISKAEKVFLAGDDDQAICESFGASAQHFLDLEGDEVFLEKSGRIPVGVHRHLFDLIPKLKVKNSSRKDKIWFPKNDNGGEGEVFNFSKIENFISFLVEKVDGGYNEDIILMFVTNGSLKKFSSKLEGEGISHFSANQIVGNKSSKIKLLTIWGAKGGQSHMTALITDSDMDVRMLNEDPRLEYVAHSRAQYSFYYVGRYQGVNVPRHGSDNFEDDNFIGSRTKNFKNEILKPTETSAKVSINNLQNFQNSVDNYFKTKNEPARQIEAKRKSVFDDMDDDIPF